MCGDCGFSWGKNKEHQSYFVLPCQHHHILCPVCFSSLMASKGTMHYFNCPCCKGEDEKGKHTHWDVVSSQKLLRRGGTSQQRQTHSLSPPDPNLNPVLHHHTKSIMNGRRGEGNNSEPDNLTLSLTRTTRNPTRFILSNLNRGY